MLVDLNVPWPQQSFDSPPSNSDIQSLKSTITMLHTLGYTHLALNFTINHHDKFPQLSKDINPIDLSLFSDVCEATGVKLYTRITLIIDDPSKGQSLSKISQAYDIVAALPISGKGLVLATSNLDIDLLTFHYDQRLPFILKHKTMGSCVSRGVKVEIVYVNALRDTRTRRQFINNVKNVIRSCRNRGIIMSSGAMNPLECRNIVSVTSILNFIGLPNDKCGKAMGELASLALLNGRLRTKSYKQVICVGNEDVVNEEGLLDNPLVKIVKREHPMNQEDIETIPSKRKKT